MVNKAATEIESKGKASFPEFRKVDSEWFHGDTYLLVYDLQLNTLFDAPYPSLEGLNGVGFHDSAGKAFIEEFAKVAETQGSGWVEYKWPKRGQSQPSDKWVFVKAVTVDGVPGLVGGCFYPE